MIETSISATVDSPWFPQQLRTPSTSGVNGDFKFAFFAAKRRLLIERAGEWALYDCGEHQISGLRAPLAEVEPLLITSQLGECPISQLRQVT